MVLFNLSHAEAKKVLCDSRELHNVNYKDTKNRVLLEKVLQVQGIENVTLWLQQMRDITELKEKDSLTSKRKAVSQ